ncbi:unnamed protein product, partial [Prorocentrum cordatum]
DCYCQCGHKVQLWSPWNDTAKGRACPGTTTNDKQMRDLLKAADHPTAVAEAIKSSLQAQAKKPPPTEAWEAVQKAKQELRRAEQASQRAAAVVLRVRTDLETASEAHAAKIEELAAAETANNLIIHYDIFETAGPADMDEGERNTFLEYKKQFDAARPQLESAVQKLQNLMESIQRFDQDRAAKGRRGQEVADSGAPEPAAVGAATPAAAPPPAKAATPPPADGERFKSLVAQSIRQAAEAEQAHPVASEPALEAQLFFASVIEWGPRVERWVASSGKSYQVLAMVETRISQAKQLQEFLKLDEGDWLSSMCYAVPTGLSAEGATGGKMVLARNSVAAATFDAVRRQSRQWYAVDPCRGFALVSWHRKTGGLVVIAFYIEPRDSIAGPAHERMVALTALLNML